MVYRLDWRGHCYFTAGRFNSARKLTWRRTRVGSSGIRFSRRAVPSCFQAVS